MSATTTVNLYQVKRGIVPRIEAVQYDTGRLIQMVLSDSVLNSNCSASLGFVRPNGTVYLVNAPINVSKNSAYAQMDQALTQPGVVECQLKVSESGEIVSTYNFKINVIKSVTGSITEEKYLDTAAAIDAAVEQIDPDYSNRVQIADTISNSYIDNVISGV